MALLQPIWLWGLLGLAIPLAIHLLSRKEGKVIRIGSVRFLTESNTQQFKSLRLNEILLLALRSLLIALIVMLLAQLAMYKQSDARWVLVEPGLDQNPTAKQSIDSLLAQGFEFHYFSTGFPTELPEDKPGQSYESILRELSNENLKEAVVLSISQLSSFGMDFLSLPSNVRWISIDPGNKTFLQSAHRVSGTSARIRTGISDQARTEFRTEMVTTPLPFYQLPSGDSIAIVPVDTLHISIQSDEAFLANRSILEAALRVIGENTSTPILLTTERPNWLIWLSNNPPPKFDGSVIRTTPNGQNLITPIDRTHWFISSDLLSHQAAKQHLPVQLANVLLSSRREATVSPSNDLRVMPESMMWSKEETSPQKTSEASVPLDQWIIFFILLTLLAERAVAHFRRL